MTGETRKLRDVCLGIFDGPHATPPKANEGPVFLGISNLNNGRIDLSGVEYISAGYFERWTRRVIPRPGDLVFSYETRLGEAALIPDGLRCCLGRRLGLLRPDPAKIDSRFLLYSYIGPDFQEFLETRVLHGSTVDRLPIAEFPDFPILVPPLAQQKSVASVLGSLDDKIELNRRMNRALEALVSALFKSWFMDFDPVVAKREGKLPIGVPADAVGLFPSHFEDSVLGPIPKGWMVSTIGSEVAVVGGSTPSTGEARFWNGDICWITPRDLSRLRDPVVLDSERHITAEGLEQIGSGLLPARTVLLSSRAPIGYLAISEVPVAVNQGFIAMKCDKAISPYFVLNWTRENLDEVLSRAGGTTFAEISKSSFRAIPVILPSSVVLRCFDDIARPLHEQLVSNVTESQTLASLRDVLLPPLLSGELTVRAAEKAVAEVV